jgi:hypothetical protein
MSREQPQDRPRAVQGRAFLFIEQNPESFQRENIRKITSHARRWQTARNHKDRRAEARREALYARGLVGWQTLEAARSEKNRQPVWNLESVTPSGYDTNQQEATPLGKMPSPISGGLRADPFNSLPAPSSRSVMEMVDYCKHNVGDMNCRLRPRRHSCVVSTQVRSL